MKNEILKNRFDIFIINIHDFLEREDYIDNKQPGKNWYKIR
jgi:hypothetical protein